MTTTGRVHSWDLSTGVDGPGTRLVVFLSGCPLRCLYCQNPDTWRMRDGAEMGASEIDDLIRRYRPFLKLAGGGVTVSGGEPLQQPRFVHAIFERAKRAKVSTALDTSGFLGFRADEALLDVTDLVLLDIKAGYERTYQDLTGRGLSPTLDFAERLAWRGIPIWLRYVLVPDLTDDLREIDVVASFAAGLGNVERVDVLPFHRLGASKYEQLGIEFPLAETPAPTRELVESVRARFAGHGLVAH